jgi:hypothetical protein
VTGRRRLLALAACAVVVLATAWYAGSRFAPSAPPPAAGSVRLGPEPGADVGAYLAGLPATLPPPGATAPALVQFAAEATTADALAAVAGTSPRTAVFRVPLPRVQTALRFEPLEGALAPAAALDAARQRAGRAAEGDARLPGRPGAVAAAEAAALADPACGCVLALVVDADRRALAAVAGRPGVRAVHAAPPGTEPVELALAPLLPGQTDRVTPLPDDGPVPAP